jgi:cytochrome c1
VYAFVVIILAATLSGCGQHERDITSRRLTGGNADVGRILIYAYGCGSCHTIPGVAEANGSVGPPLDGFAHRTYIGGSLTNTRENLLRWIRHPQQVEPGNAMPDLGVSEEQARDIAAYLHTLF